MKIQWKKIKLKVEFNFQIRHYGIKFILRFSSLKVM